MYKVFIIIFLICLVIIYLSNDCFVKEPFTNNMKELFTNNMKEPFTNSNPGTSPLIYSNAEKEKTLAILKDHYEIDALLNIVQVAKGLQSTTGYTVPGSLKIEGSLEVGDNIRITSDTTDGDVITVGSRTAATGTNGKVRINIGKYSLVPNLTGTDDYLEFRHNSDGTSTNDKVMAKFSKGANDKFLIYGNDTTTNSNSFYIRNREIGFNGESSTINATNISSDKVKTNNIVNTDGKSILKFENNQSKLCNATDNCDRFLYVNKDDTKGGYASNNQENTNFTITSAGNNPERKFEIINDNYDTRIWKNGKLRMAIEPGATKISASNNDFHGKHFFIENNDGDFKFGAHNTANGKTIIQLNNNQGANSILTDDRMRIIHQNHEIMNINKNDPDRLVVYTGRKKGQNGNKYWYINKDKTGWNDDKNNISDNTGWL
jgi:hypothetical protein